MRPDPPPFFPLPLQDPGWCARFVQNAAFIRLGLDLPEMRVLNVHFDVHCFPG